jgi:hypothetical protein
LDIWTVPLIIVVLIICMIGFISVRKWNKANTVFETQDSQTAATVEEHPFTLNPIFWVILVSVFFIGIVIFYYAASS